VDGDSDGEYDPKTLEILKQARNKARAQSPAHAQEQTYTSLDAQLSPQAEEPQDWVKVKVHWQGPPIEGASNKWTFQFSLVRFILSILNVLLLFIYGIN
jgi:hypothetical protein